MKIPMKKRPSVKEWAKQFGVDIHIAEQYQKMRRRWMNRVTAFARKYGGTPSRDIPADVRDLRPMRGGDFEQYIESRAATIESRSAIASIWLKQKQDTYLSNIALMLSESPNHQDDIEIQAFGEWFNRATTAEKAQLIKAMGGSGVRLLITSGKLAGQDAEVSYDFSVVISAIREVIMK